MKRVSLRTIKISDTGDRQYIGLAEEGTDRILTIVIGYSEALAIQRFVNEDKPKRPLTHDLLGTVLEATHTTLERVDITELRKGTYYAMIRLGKPDGSIAEVDARPSDAIALATLLDAPIYVADDVMEAALSE